MVQGQAAPRVPGRHQLLLLTNPELEIVERVLVDLLYAFGQGEREVGQGAQVFPLVFTLLQQTGEGSLSAAHVNRSGAGACARS